MSLTITRPGKYFSWSEMTVSRTASRLGLSNDPNRVERANLQRLVSTILDPLRTALRRPVVVTSAFRSRVVNARIGGSKTSRHMLGLAADIKVGGLRADLLARRIHRLGLPVDQVIWYDPERGGHVHVGLAMHGQTPRGQYLHAPKDGGYRPWAP